MRIECRRDDPHHLAADVGRRHDAARPAPSLREPAVLVIIYVTIATFVHGLIVMLAGTIEAFLAAPQRRKVAGNVFAVVLLLVAARLFASGAR